VLLRRLFQPLCGSLRLRVRLWMGLRMRTDMLFALLGGVLLPASVRLVLLQVLVLL
jgi:hypothetical protein